MSKASLGTAVLWMLVSSARLAAYSPDSPEVREAIERGTKYLTESVGRETRLGGKVLVARALVYDDRRDDPLVQAAIDAIDAEIAKDPFRPDIYSAGLAIVLLTELDAQKHRKRIDAFLEFLKIAQKDHGGWGYEGRPTGDTSMTQYALLGLWTASRNRIPVPEEMWIKAANWLLRTQDPQGPWGYQGNDPGSFDLVAQEQTSPTMTLAGLGSLYLCAEHFGIVRIVAKEEEQLLHGALRKIKETEPVVEPAAVPEEIDASRILNAIALAEEWHQKHRRDLPPTYHPYFFYTLERMQAIREAIAEEPPTSLEWYDDATKYMLPKQSPEGGWTGEEGEVPATAFIVLLLHRSMRETINAPPLGAGTLIGGRGLPTASDEVMLRLGEVVARPLAGPASDLLTALENPQAPNFDRALEGLNELIAADDVATLDANARRLVEIAGSRDPEARAVAIRALSRTRELDHVPLFIAAFSDDDVQVIEAAREAMYFVSRRGPPFSSPSNKPADVGVEQEQWKLWYRGIRPDAKLNN